MNWVALMAYNLNFISFCVARIIINARVKIRKIRWLFATNFTWITLTRCLATRITAVHRLSATFDHKISQVKIFQRRKILVQRLDGEKFSENWKKGRKCVSKEAIKTYSISSVTAVGVRDWKVSENVFRVMECGNVNKTGMKNTCWCRELFAWSFRGSDELPSELSTCCIKLRVTNWGRRSRNEHR